MSHESALDALVPKGMDYAAMGVAFAAYFVFSFLWWGPLFGRKWAKEMGMEMNPETRPSMMMPLVWQTLGSLLLSYVLWHVMEAFVVTHDANGIIRGDLAIGTALMGAFFTWLGFYVPQQLGKISWEKGTWTLFGINSAGHLLGLAIMGVVFALM